MSLTNITDTTLVATHTRGSMEYNTAKGKSNVRSTGATAGIPGTWSPSGSTPPDSPAAMTGVVATPGTAWTSGQYVQTGTAGPSGRATWTGSAWVGGAAPLDEGGE